MADDDFPTVAVVRVLVLVVVQVVVVRLKELGRLFGSVLRLLL